MVRTKKSDPIDSSNPGKLSFEMMLTYYFWIITLPNGDGQVFFQRN